MCAEVGEHGAALCGAAERLYFQNIYCKEGKTAMNLTENIEKIQITKRQYRKPSAELVLVDAGNILDSSDAPAGDPPDDTAYDIWGK